MSPIVVLLLTLAAAPPAGSIPIEIRSNKPFIRTTVNGSVPQWFILDTGCPDKSMIARDCAERLKLPRGAEETGDVGAGSGFRVGLSQATGVVQLSALGETLSVAQPIVMTMSHLAPVEGRHVDGLIGQDFFMRHVVEIDYATSSIVVRDPATYTPPKGATIVPLDLETGWGIAEATITPKGGEPRKCRLIVDTGVRGIVTMFRPFSTRHSLYDAAGPLHNAVTGMGVGGVSRGDVIRLDAMTLGPASFAQPVATLSRDTTGIFALDGPEGILGGELLRRHRTTFDYPHQRLILEPYRVAKPEPFEFDMSGLFLLAEAPDFTRIFILSVNPNTPATQADLRPGDEIVSIDGQRTPALKLDVARAMLRKAATRQLEVRRGEQVMKVKLTTRRLI
jgi:hypothetical protein